MVILAARRVIEEVAQLQAGEFPAILVFVDFVKAFDSVHWDPLWIILERARVPTRVGSYGTSGLKIRQNIRYVGDSENTPYFFASQFRMLH